MHGIHALNAEQTQEYSWLGHPNDAPPNLREITEDEFWQTFGGAYSPLFKFHRYVTRGLPVLGRERAVDLELWMYQGGRAIGWVRNVVSARAARPVMYVECFQCEHEMVSRRVGRCLHEYKCSKCGYQHTVDSSD